VFWTFPNDRKLATLPLLTRGSPELAGLLGRPCEDLRVVAYAAERSASARCLDGDGNALAYVKIHAGDGAEHERRQLAAAGPLVPRVLATSAEHGALALEPIPGARLDSLRGAELAHGLRGLGAALARLHTTTPVPDEPFTRLDPERLGKAVAVIARARPDAGRAAALALAELLTQVDEADDATVCVHGDANLRNAILDGERVALLDLEHAAAGPAAADLGQLLAGLRTDRVLGRISTPEETALAGALLDGYATVTRPPESLRWHTNASLLARVAQSAINRVREDVLHALVPLLEAAA
jgi:aminoglycoside phosphotransferase